MTTTTTTCKRGHDLTDTANRYERANGKVDCRACDRETRAERAAARRAEAIAKIKAEEAARAAEAEAATQAEKTAAQKRRDAHEAYWGAMSDTERAGALAMRREWTKARKARAAGDTTDQKIEPLGASGYTVAFAYADAPLVRLYKGEKSLGQVLLFEGAWVNARGQRIAGGLIAAATMLDTEPTKTAKTASKSVAAPTTPTTTGNDGGMSLERAETMIKTLMAEHLSEDHSEWVFAWDNARTRGGVARFGRKQISMSRHLVPMWTEEQVRNTALHEIAHVLAGVKAGHGPQWRKIAREIGCDARRTHNNETVPARWEGTCKCEGKVFRRHRLTNRARYGTCLVCKSMLAWTDTQA